VAAIVKKLARVLVVAIACEGLIVLVFLERLFFFLVEEVDVDLPNLLKKRQYSVRTRVGLGLPRAARARATAACARLL
jgi:hypothetical protein